MHLRWLIFSTLIGVHVAVFIFAPELIAPLVAGSIYLPLWPLSTIGIPVFGVAASGGWAAPSLLGWAVVFGLPFGSQSLSFYLAFSQKRLDMPNEQG